MFGLCKSCWDNDDGEIQEEPEPFSLPSPLPPWPQGKGFSTGEISLGQIRVAKITKFEKISSCSPVLGKGNAITFYRPVGIPDRYYCLGHYCQPSDQQLRGYVLVAKSISTDNSTSSAPLEKPLNYTKVWSSSSRRECVYVWLPNPPQGYKAAGFVVTAEPDEPDVGEVRCVREDLTESCEVGAAIFDSKAIFSKDKFYVWSTRPCERGFLCDGVPVGTFYCSRGENSDLSIACLKNLDASLSAMPTLDQVDALIEHYGPTLYFHPDEVYLPSSVSWFFESGVLLYEDGNEIGIPVDLKGSNLPRGGINDKRFWLDLPKGDDKRDLVKCGDIDSAELYVHVKPASGGTFTDIAMWVFCPFNGPSTIKAGSFNYEFDRIGEHVGDWEHYTLRLSNFDGELWSIYFSEHSGGGWRNAAELEFVDGNKSAVYASKNGHASFPHEGCYLQGSDKLGIGARNDCAKSKYAVDSSRRYKIIAAEYLGDAVPQPCWLQYMREWGPTIVYDSRSELEKILSHLPFFLRFSLESFIELFPTELYGEEGPTGPKEKDNWFGDERW
ncbi:hypothetical protein At1g04090 [Andrographis paniculata]|uniref:hypothetical protein At1g04090 n=1 Tax=Andrographis paniculata TaxID=175694 RepID=UPI0021E8DFD7|nr:hypothetical protein At1g04090 [Andrographis paniculata]XP_051119982.1 hypothetical protein At1g04090 [Andrographis paniculata]